jgi:thioredoxin reductase (NADPH)
MTDVICADASTVGKIQQSANVLIHQVVIIGRGCAGLTAGLYLGRADLKPILFSGQERDKGGLLTKTSIVENYPGFFPNDVDGFKLMQNTETQAVNYGLQVIDRSIIKIERDNLRNHENIFILEDDQGEEYYTRTIILATGSTPNKLGLKDESRFWSRGISSCVTCDGALYKNKKIVVVGGGDSAMEEAMFLTKFSRVTLIHRRNEFRASKSMIRRVMDNNEINILFDTAIDEFIGDDKLSAIKVKNVKTGEITILEVDGLFYGLGLKPNSDVVKNFVELDSDGYVIAGKYNPDFQTGTSVDGIFVAGDVCDKIYRKAVVACSDGYKAALDVNRYLAINSDREIILEFDS